MWLLPGTPGFRENLEGPVDLFMFDEPCTKARRALLGACSIILIIFHFEISITSVNISGVGFSEFSSVTVLKVAWIFSFYFFVRFLLYGFTDLRNWKMRVVKKAWPAGRIGETPVARMRRLGDLVARLNKKESDKDKLAELHELRESILQTEVEATKFYNRFKSLVFWERFRISVFEILLPIGVFGWATWAFYTFELPEKISSAPDLSGWLF